MPSNSAAYCLYLQHLIMTSSSQIIADTLPRSQATATPDNLPFEPSNFDAFSRTTHPEKAKLGLSGKQKTSGRVIYEYLHYPPDNTWLNGKRGNAIYHAKSKHSSILQIETSTLYKHDSDITPLSKQPRRDGFFSELTIRYQPILYI